MTGTKAGYTSVSKTSASTAVVTDPQVTNTVLPKITGTVGLAKTLTAVDGSWGRARLC